MRFQDSRAGTWRVAQCQRGERNGTNGHGGRRSHTDGRGDNTAPRHAASSLAAARQTPWWAADSDNRGV
jgi:hypothetical protein